MVQELASAIVLWLVSDGEYVPADVVEMLAWNFDGLRDAFHTQSVCNATMLEAELL